MLIYLQIDPIDTLSSVKVRDYPALTSIAGSPFSGGSLTHLGDGLWSVNIGSVTGDWIVHAFNASGDLLRDGYASSDYLVGGNATVIDYPSWLTPGAIGGGSGGVVPVGSHTIEFFTGEIAARTVTCIDGDGNLVTLTGLTLEIVIEDYSSNDGQVIAAGDITILGTDFTFAPDAGITAVEKTWLWSLRNTANGMLLMSGLMPIYYAAYEGSEVVPSGSGSRFVIDGGSW